MTESSSLPHGVSLTPMDEYEELMAWLAGQRPHVAVLVRKDGVIETRVAPNEPAAFKAYVEMITANVGHIEHAYVKPR